MSESSKVTPGTAETPKTQPGVLGIPAQPNVIVGAATPLMATPVANTTYVSFSAEINQPTTEALLGVCADLANRKVDIVYLMLSSPGGSVMCGLTLYNVLRAMPFKLITHNVGNVDSIGNCVFLAGTERYCCPNATFMFHGVGFDVSGTVRFDEKLLRERTDGVQADQRRIAAVIRERAKIDPDELDKLFLEAVTRDPSYALSRGIIDEIRDVQIPKGAPILQLVFKR
jgi:ATP-dependent Clp protease protease subunit